MADPAPSATPLGLPGAGGRRHYARLMDEPVIDAWRISPNGPLVGEVLVSGSKNAVTKHMVAATLGTRPSTITNAPEVGDVGITADILTSLGVGVEIDGDTVTVDPVDVRDPRVSMEFTGLNRIPILMLGPLLARNDEAFVPLVGGDRIGKRPVDFHVAALDAMGAEVDVSADGISARARRLHGARITLPYPSVGATERVLLTAVLAEGRTVLRNAALEPEVIELALFLQRMGARIEFKPDRRIVIEGVDELTRRRRPTRRRPHRGVLVPGRRAHHRRAGPGAGCAQDRLVTAIDHAPEDGRHASRSPTTSSRPGPTTGCGRRPCRPTPTPGS